MERNSDQIWRPFLDSSRQSETLTIRLIEHIKRPNETSACPYVSGVFVPKHVFLGHKIVSPRLSCLCCPYFLFTHTKSRREFFLLWRIDDDNSALHLSGLESVVIWRFTNKFALYFSGLENVVIWRFTNNFALYLSNLHPETYQHLFFVFFRSVDRREPETYQQFCVLFFRSVERCDPETYQQFCFVFVRSGECCDLETCQLKAAASECRGKTGDWDLPEYCTGENYINY